MLVLHPCLVCFMLYCNVFEVNDHDCFIPIPPISFLNISNNLNRFIINSTLNKLVAAFLLSMYHHHSTLTFLPPFSTLFPSLQCRLQHKYRRPQACPRYHEFMRRNDYGRNL